MAFVLPNSFRPSTVALGACCSYALLALPGCNSPRSEGEACQLDRECIAEHVCFEAQCRKLELVLKNAAEACGASKGCTENGHCTAELSQGPQPLIDSERWKCFARSDAECGRSEICRKESRCEYDRASSSCTK